MIIKVIHTIIQATVVTSCDLTVLIALHRDTTPVDQLCACVQAEILEFIITHGSNWNDKVCPSVVLSSV